jgi:hypothetical protein
MKSKSAADPEKIIIYLNLRQIKKVHAKNAW